MSIASEISRLQGAKANLKTAIEGKGVTVPSATKIDGYANLVSSIPSGGSATLVTKNISANGTYNASSDSADGYSQVTVAVPASAVDTGTKSISTNGTHDVVGYANANVNVPNSYSAGDEGKVVSNGALVSQSSATYTANDTYDTTLINSVTVNVSGGGSDLADILARSATSISLSGITTLGKDVFYKYTNLTSATFPDVTTMGGEAFRECTGLTDVSFASLGTIAGAAFRGCTKLASASFPSAKKVGSEAFFSCKKLTTFVVAGSGSGSSFTIEMNAFYGCSMLASIDHSGNMIEGAAFSNCTVLNTLVLRRTDAVVTLGSTNVFSGTPFASGGSGGTIYVPSSLLSTYPQSTNWTTLDGYGTVTWAAIEGSQYENYYADGTPIT